MKKKHRTEAQKQAARLNGAKSHGPVTPEGKAVSAQNAMRHGLTARRVVLGNELEEVWDDFIEALTEEWNPQTPTELQLIHDLAAARWRLNRLLDIETESLEIEMSRQEEHYEQVVIKGTELTRITFAWQSLQKEGTLPAIHRHKVRLRRVVRESLNQLIMVQSRRRAAEEVLPATTPAPLQNQPEPATAPPQNEPEPLPDTGADEKPTQERHERQNEPGKSPIILAGTRNPHLERDPNRPGAPPLPDLRAA